MDIFNYADYDDRLLSFVPNWPLNRSQKPTELAEAGFYYMGESDRTKCFFCYGGLWQWEPEDDPWEQHAMHHPMCGFVLAVRGQEFIDQMRHMKNAKKKAEQFEVPNILVIPNPLPVDERQEFEELKAERTCKVCLDKKVEISFQPCGHCVTCRFCCRTLDKCPVCRSNIVRKYRIFMA